MHAVGLVNTACILQRKPLIIKGIIKRDKYKKTS